MSELVCPLLGALSIVVLVSIFWTLVLLPFRRKPIPLSVKAITINLNDGVWVKLTPAGRKAAEETEAIYSGRDEGPYTYFQLWCLMASLGPLLTMTSKNFIEGNVIHLSRPKDAIRNS